MCLCDNKAVLTVTVYQIGCDCVYDNNYCAQSLCIRLGVIVYQTRCDSVYDVTIKAVLAVTVYQRECDCVNGVTTKVVFSPCVSERV